MSFRPLSLLAGCCSSLWWLLWTTTAPRGAECFVVTSGVSGVAKRPTFSLDAYRDFAATAAASSSSVSPQELENMVGRRGRSSLSVEEAALPWTVSIADRNKKDESVPLLFRPFWQWQMDFLQSSLTNLRVAPMSEQHAFRKSHNGKARVVSQCFSSDEYRKIRITYYDAGEGAQIYTSVFYPRFDSSLPVLGLDLLAFGGRKFVAAMDFHPVTPEQHDDEEMTRRLAPIRDLYPSLQQPMSSQYYDASFFSPQKLLGRFDSAAELLQVLPAFSQYLQQHVEWMQQTTPLRSHSNEEVRQGQAAYDTYLARRDPGLALLQRMFGNEWTDSFVYDFLFSLSQRPTPEEETQLQQERQTSAAAAAAAATPPPQSQTEAPRQ